MPGKGKRKGSKGQTDKDLKTDDVGDKKKKSEGISGRSEAQVPLSFGIGASIGSSPAAGDRVGHQHGATPSVHYSEEPQHEDDIKYWEEVIRDSNMKIKAEKYRIKEAERMKKAVKKKAKGHSTSSQGHTNSSTSQEAPLSPAPSTDTAWPESSVFDCDVSQEDEPKRKPSSSGTVDLSQLELKVDKLNEKNKLLLSQQEEKNQQIAQLKQEKDCLNMKCEECAQQSQVALKEKELELSTRCKELETIKSECASLKVSFEQKCAEVEKIAGDHEKHFAAEKMKLDDDYSQQLQEKERSNQQLVEEIKLLQDESTKRIEELQKELEDQGDTKAKDREDVKAANVVQQEQYLQQIRILEDKIEQINGEHEEEAAKLRGALKEQEKCSADCKEQAERLSQELADAKIRLDEDVKHLREEMLRKDELKVKEIAELKDSSDKRIECEVQQQIRRQDAVYRERLRSLKEEVKRLTDDVENKNSAISKLSEQLKSQEEIAKRDVDQQQRIRANKDEIESMRMEKQKSEQNLKSDLDSLGKQLQSSLEELKSVICDNEELKVSLDERNKELNEATDQNATLTSEYDKLRGDYTRLSEQFEQLKVEADMKKELSEFSSSIEPCESPVHELQLQQGAHADDDNEEYHSASESSLNGQDQASNHGLTDFQNKQPFQQTEEVEQSTKQAIQEAQRWRDNAHEMESKMKHLNKQLDEFREWQRLLVEEAKEEDSDDSLTARGPKAVNYDKYKELKKKFLFLTEKIIKCEGRNAEMVEKLIERDEQIKELKSGTMSLPMPCESSTYSSDGELSDKIDEQAALSEIERLKKALVDKDNHITSLQAQLSSTGLTTSERNKMEMHGKEQSKIVMEWRKKFELAEKEIQKVRAEEAKLVEEVRELQNNLKEIKSDYERELLSKEDEVKVLKGEVSAKKGNVHSIDVQALHIEYETKIEALKTEVALSEMSSQQRYETLEAEADSLRQQLRESELQYAHTKDMYNNVSNQLVRFNRFQDEVKALKENAVKMSDVVAAKAAEAVNLKEETESLQEMLKAIEEELERRKIEAHTYKEDFDKERKDRENAASKHEEEKSNISIRFQKDIDDLNEQIKVLVSKHRLEEEENMMLKKGMEDSRESYELLTVEKQSLAEAFSKLEDKFKEKEATLEKTMAHKCDLENQLFMLKEESESKVQHCQEVTATLNAECDKLQNEKNTLSSECQAKTELNNTLRKEIEAVSSDCQAKTQQVKQYRKQADTLKVQIDNMWAELQETKTKVNEYERQLQYYQEQVRQLTEDEEQKAEVVKAQFEAEVLNLNRDLDKLRKEKASLEGTRKHEIHNQDLGIDKATVHIQALSEQLERMNAINRQLELQQAALQEKYHQVTEKCEVQWRQVDALTMVLQNHQIPVPTLEQPPRRSQQPPPTRHPQNLACNQTTPHEASQYNQPQMPRSQPIGQAFASQLREADGLANVSVDGRRMVADNGSIIVSEAHQPVLDHQGHQAHTRSQDNALMQSINTEIHRTYAGVGREVSSQPELESLSRHAPFDPNLVCPMCRVPFRIGEIQKYRQHVKFCQGT